jgi:endonuclease/exonuclease/phosphatase family metal-dependent hydrolase
MIPTPIKIVSFNTYLVAKQFNQNRDTYPEKRASWIRNFLQGKDLCFLQEVWGSGLPELTDEANHSLPPSRLPPFGLSFFGELANTFYLHLLKTGGLFDLAAPMITCEYRAKHTFSKSRSKSLKGVEATLWKIPQWQDDRSLLVLNTHLDPWHLPNRQLQVNEIVQFLKETLKNIDEECQGQHDWSQTGVLVVGDFNIKADSEEYHKVLLKQQGWRDYCLGETQQTYALENSLVSSPEDCGRIDYIFGVSRFGKYQFLPLECLSTSIEKQPHGQELSDHYPLVVEMIPRNSLDR